MLISLTFRQKLHHFENFHWQKSLGNLRNFPIWPILLSNMFSQFLLRYIQREHMDLLATYQSYEKRQRNLLPVYLKAFLLLPYCLSWQDRLGKSGFDCPKFWHVRSSKNASYFARGNAFSAQTVKDGLRKTAHGCKVRVNVQRIQIAIQAIQGSLKNEIYVLIQGVQTNYGYSKKSLNS